MEILQSLISDNHHSSMFYEGVIAYGRAKDGKVYVLTTQGDSEITMGGIKHYGDEIVEMGKTFFLCDYDMEEENILSILADNFFVIAETKDNNIEDVLHEEEPDEYRIFNEYGEAINVFETFLNQKQ